MKRKKTNQKARRSTISFGKSKRNKVERKCQWSDQELDDSTDIIVGNDNLLRKLVFQNAPTKANSRNYESIQKVMKEQLRKRKQIYIKKTIT